MIMPGSNPLTGMAAIKPVIVHTQHMPASMHETSIPKQSVLKASESRNPEIVQAAQDFEAAFIGQMLKHSGFGQALTKTGGEAVSAFTDFYIENIADDIAAKGGFGLAEHFYKSLISKTEPEAL